MNLETCNSISNTASSNNTFVYSLNSGMTWKTIALPEGSYEVVQIHAEIQQQLEVNGDWGFGTTKMEAKTLILSDMIEITNSIYKVVMAALTIQATLSSMHKL